MGCVLHWRVHSTRRCNGGVESMGLACAKGITTLPLQGVGFLIPVTRVSNRYAEVQV